MNDILQRERSGRCSLAHRIDSRSIKDVRASDLSGFSRCHFFSGIAGWEHALRIAGWDPRRPVWTGSCPCQSYSVAGKQKGDADDRNLWPDWFRLIRECRPDTIFGEQVANAIRHGWLDGISSDLEGEGYTVGAVVLGAHSVGASHQRQRLYWVAHRAMADDGSVGHSGLQGPQRRGGGSRGRDQWIAGATSVVNAWSDYDIIHCADGKARRTQSGLFPLAHGLPSGMVPSGDPSIQEVKATAEGRVMRLRGYGNSIVPQVASAFIKAFMETLT